MALVEVGAYDQAWPDWHKGPEQAIEASQMLQGRLSVPIHWGLWSLAAHGWTEPVERAMAEAERLQVPIYVPQPGESFEPSDLPEQQLWWPSEPWRSAEEHPVQTHSR